MKNVLKLLLALTIAVCLMLCVRALFFTIYTVNGSALEPVLTVGDRVLVNRWSYGLRTGGGRFFDYTRWMASQPSRGDLVAFNFPLDTARSIARRPVYICFCKAVPGDSVSIGGKRLIVPGRRHIVRISADNINLLSFLYNRYEGREATVKGGNLYVDGRMTRCAAFSKDYYWMSAVNKSDFNDSRFFGLVPETHLIGKVSMLLYSIDSTRPLPNRLRTERTLLFINSGGKGVEKCATCP